MKFSGRKKVRPAYQPETTFKRKVEQFWDWYSTVADRLAEGFDNKDISSDEVVDLVRSKLDELISGVAWCFGPALDKIGHHLALSPEGDENTLMLSTYWAKCAPDLPVWEFYPAKPGRADADGSLNMLGRKFDFSEMSAALKPDHDNQTAHIRIYHPSFSELDDNQKITVTFISLDEILGELGTEIWLSNVETSEEPLPDSFPFSELSDKLHQFFQVMEWKMRKASECWHSYSFAEPDPELPYPQADSYTKSSNRPQFIRDYFNNAEKFTDPLIKEGAATVYVAIPSEWFPEENAVYARGEIEDAVSEALESERSGVCVGGGMGHVFGYCDFLIFDGERSIGIIQQAVQPFNLPSEAHISFFDGTLRNVRYPVAKGT